MANNYNIFNAAASLLIRATLAVARFSGRIRRRSPQRLAALDRLRFRAIEHAEIIGTLPPRFRTPSPPGSVYDRFGPCKAATSVQIVLGFENPPDGGDEA